MSEFKEIEARKAIDFLLPKHYSGRKPNVSVAYGCFVNRRLEAVVTFGKPASHSLCVGVCGPEFSTNVYELNRLCASESLKINAMAPPISKLVGYALRRLRSRNWIVVSYADEAMGHKGKIYQACNFIYTGCTKGRTDKWAGEGKHSRHYDKDAVEEFRVVRSPKHRYIYFCTSDKKLKRDWAENLNYKVEAYPDGESDRYKLGEYIKPKIIKLAGQSNRQEVEG
jgi:hypothetical protein